MTYSKCPNCGAIHPVKNAPAKNRSTMFVPCRTCRVNGELSRLAWEAPRRNRYRRG